MAREKFDLTKLLGNRNLSQESAKETTGADSQGLITVLLDIYDLIPSKQNFYKVDDVAELKDSIEMFGIKQNLVVQRIPGENSKYEIIAGHRRREASRLLVEEGKERHRFVPCHIETDLTETEKRLLLILTNLPNRKMTAWEEVEQVKQLRPLLKEYKQTNKVPGRLQELTADMLNISKSKVERIETIAKNLSEEFKEELKNDNISFSAASELARLSAVDQKAAYEKHQETGTISLREAREIREEKKNDSQEATVINPTIAALQLAKAVLCKEAERMKLSGVSDFAVVREYQIIMNKKAREIDKELDKMMGYDLFEPKAGAE